MKLFEKLSFKIVIFSILFWLIFSVLFGVLREDHSLLRENLIAYVLCFSLYILFLGHHKIKNLKKLLVIISVIYPLILLKLFVWDQLPAEIEGFYKGRDFGCMCHEGIYHFKNGKVIAYNIAHQNREELGSYKLIDDQYWFTSTNGERIEVYPKKSNLVFKFGFDGEPYPKKGYRISLSTEKLNVYEKFITSDELMGRLEEKHK
ncbi:MAG: hypothetical protein NE334_04230 [Lentisphaeraceae bacterium]|nr:hypothetical protein [Lentisphaeraceae bacterium]